MRPNLTVEKITGALAVLGTSVLISACGGDAKPPVNASDVPAAGEKAAGDGHCGANKDHKPGESSCGASKAGGASCGAGAGGASCGAGKAAGDKPADPTATTTTPAAATPPDVKAPETKPAEPTKPADAKKPADTKKPGAAPAGKKTGAASCGAGTCAAKK